MNIVSLNKYDMGGMSYHLCRYINKLTDHHAVNIITAQSFTKKPFMMMKNDENLGEIKRLIRNADVLHFNEAYVWTPYDFTPEMCHGKTIIYHSHGDTFRNYHAKIKALYRNWNPNVKFITSTPDLLIYVKEGSWFPSISPLKEWRKQYKIKRNDPPIIYYSPSKSSVNRPWHWNVLNEVVQELDKEGYACQIKRVHSVLHEENMSQKAQADIYYDELQGFYGINALEAAAFELAVICGLMPFCRDYFRKQKINCGFNVVNVDFFDKPPTMRERNLLKNQLLKLLKDKQYRAQSGKQALDYLERTHSPEVCVKRFMSLVE